MIRTHIFELNTRYRSYTYVVEFILDRLIMCGVLVNIRLGNVSNSPFHNTASILYDSKVNT